MPNKSEILNEWTPTSILTILKIWITKSSAGPCFFQNIIPKKFEFIILGIFLLNLGILCEFLVKFDMSKYHKDSPIKKEHRIFSRKVLKIIFSKKLCIFSKETRNRNISPKYRSILGYSKKIVGQIITKNWNFIKYFLKL